MNPEAANRLLDDALAAGPRCAQTCVIAIDGRSGSGKTTLANEAEAAATRRGLSVATIRTDEICPGWRGLPEVPLILLGLLADLATVGTATYPTWDWNADASGPPSSVVATDILIIDGVGAGARCCVPYLSVRHLLDAPEAERKARALARDGDTFAPYWAAWADAERLYFATEWDVRAG